MDGKQNQKQRRGSNGNAEKGKKSKRSKKNKTRKKIYLEGENDVATLISHMSLKDTDTGPDRDIVSHFSFSTGQNVSLKKASSSTSTTTSSGNDDIKTKDSLSITDVQKGNISPLWLTDTVIKENFLKMSDQAADFDEAVWKSIKLTLSQKATNSLSARYNRLNYSSKVPQFEQSSSAPQAESMRWEVMLDNNSEEEERLRVYKINRRKRFLAERHEKGLELISSANNQSDVLQPTISTSYFDLNDGRVLSQMINPLGFRGADDNREMVLNCS